MVHRKIPEDFVTQAKADCYFTNGTEKVRFVVRFIFNLEEYARFDSDLGMFVALTELGKPDAELWNSRPDILARSRASVDMLCRRNYKLGAPFTVGRRGAQSEYSWRRILGGAAAFLVGLVFFLVGIVIHIRARKGRVVTPLLGNEVPRAVLPPQPH
ncbi:hypothetical protein Celaphus_00014199 [Cervus elaphus hippelaphus]|uniref:MHC class II beta chain N-terminal domain-containing protein n=1 Tax=Cervus elaphus hippelaphus TaxID=46360 RepID=A0A212D534_CEREH|nr:hypothetical protein Celaphus_00014199 [Cervus elaphus hippelaphus]